MADSYENLTVEELQDRLRARDLKVSGSKDELIARLELSDLAADDPDEVTEAAAEEAGVSAEDVVESAPEAPADEAPADEASDEAPADEAPADETPDETPDADAASTEEETEAEGSDEAEEAPAERDPALGASTADTAPRQPSGAAVNPQVRQFERADTEEKAKERDEKPVPAKFTGVAQSQPDRQSPEVAGYAIMPDGRKVPLEQPETDSEPEE